MGGAFVLTSTGGLGSMPQSSDGIWGILPQPPAAPMLLVSHGRLISP